MRRGNQQPRSNGRSYSATPQRKLEAGEKLKANFQGCKEVDILDDETGRSKTVMQYTFADSESGKRFTMRGTVMLDQAFDEVFAGEGGKAKCEGLLMEVERLRDTPVRAGSQRAPMQNYKITVWEE